MFCQSLLCSKVTQFHTYNMYILYSLYSFSLWFIPGEWI